MTKIFTPNDVVRYLYQETDKDESEEIAFAILTNQLLYEFYAAAEELTESLNTLIEIPSDRVADEIYAYAKKSLMHGIA
ncbi:MAG: hypothetical protein ACFCUU_05445 [Cyclobacteriaceae bacterium]